MSSPEPAVETVDVARSYQLDGVSVEALRGVTLRIDRGDHVAIIGPSGSGKSTLMHLLGGLDRPTSGKLMIGGRDVAELSAAEMARLRNETIGFVFQAFHLLARTSALDNVALPLVYRGLGARARRSAAAEVLERVGLAHRMEHRPNQMSGGEQQRVAIARALVTDPAMLLADEPTGNLDSATGASVLELLDELNRDGVAVVLVTHDREVAARARRQIGMRDGVIVSDSTGAAGPEAAAVTESAARASSTAGADGAARAASAAGADGAASPASAAGAARPDQTDGAAGGAL